MICPICHHKEKMMMKNMERVFVTHFHSEVVLVCPGSNRTAKEALEIAKNEESS